MASNRRRPSRLKRLATAAAAFLLCAGTGAVYGQGLTASRELSAASLERSTRTSCPDANDDKTGILTLRDIFKLALCQSVTFRQAQATVAEQQASADLARADFQPQVVLSNEVSGNRIPLGSDAGVVNAKSASTFLGLSWVLFDFGQRDALLNASREQLASALLGLDAGELQAIADTLRLYVEAVAAWERLGVVAQAQDAAKQNLRIAQGRYEGQIGTLADKLLAETTLAQANLESVRAATAWDIARGALSLSLGRPVGRMLALDGWRKDAAETWDVGPVDTLAEEALQVHPRAQALKAEIRALESRAEAVRKEGFGSVSVNAGVGASRSLQGNSSTSRNLNGSVVYSIPFFRGNADNARRAQFEAQAEGRKAQYTGIERELKLALWTAVRQLQADEESIAASAAFLKSATAGLDVTTGRYKAGVATLTELLAAQTSLTTAKFQQSQAMVALLGSKIRLVVASGRLPIKF
ncbi:MAG: TolC family protein [Pseudomonadota bacterium]